jgi:hypothetical protein
MTRTYERKNGGGTHNWRPEAFTLVGPSNKRLQDIYTRSLSKG